MLTSDGPRVLEFNCRFGDPETQSVVPLLEGDLLEALAAAAAGELAGVSLETSPDAAVTVVLAARAYPAGSDRGSTITGVEEAEAGGRARLPRRHRPARRSAGDERGPDPERDGGRRDVAEARAAAYGGADLIEFDGGASARGHRARRRRRRDGLAAPRIAPANSLGPPRASSHFKPNREVRTGGKRLSCRMANICVWSSAARQVGRSAIRPRTDHYNRPGDPALLPTCDGAHLVGGGEARGVARGRAGRARRLGAGGHASAEAPPVDIRARATAPTPERVAELERTTNHDVAAFVDAVASELGPTGRWFHYGLTSSDVLDTALALTVQDAGRLVLAGIDRAWSAVVERAEEHRDTLTIGRTHGVHAEPMTFGLKLAGWAFQLARDRRRVESALEGMRVGKLSGAVGTYSATPPEVERLACESLGLEPAPSSTQILQRDRHAELLSALALVASSLDRFALEIRHLARTEVREVEEPFVRGQKGSSAMPHKRNPIVAERICGLARLVRGYAARRARERRPLARARHLPLLGRACRPSRRVSRGRLHARPLSPGSIEGLVVRPERMRANLEATGGLFFSQRLLLSLVDSGLDRDTAYRAVQQHAMRAWDEGLDFRTLVRGDPELAGRVDLDEVFDLGAFTQHTDVIFQRLQATRREEIHA